MYGGSSLNLTFWLDTADQNWSFVGILKRVLGLGVGNSPYYRGPVRTFMNLGPIKRDPTFFLPFLIRALRVMHPKWEF